MDTGDLESRVTALEEPGARPDRAGHEQPSRTPRPPACSPERQTATSARSVVTCAIFRKATTAGFNALRQDFVDLRRDFVDLREHVDRGFTEMRGKFDAAAAGQQQIVGLLHTITTDKGPTGATE